MIEKIRTLMLFIAISVLGYGGYIFMSTFQATSENIDIKFDKDGLDVKIKNFKVVHQDSGRRDWQLKADLAQINKKQETTKMNNVQYVFFNNEMKKFKIYADFGTLKNKTNDLELEGNVKMLVETGIIKDELPSDFLSQQNSTSINR
jgi:LPS export ABC transporter protein LptC